MPNDGRAPDIAHTQLRALPEQKVVNPAAALPGHIEEPASLGIGTAAGQRQGGAMKQLIAQHELEVPEGISVEVKGRRVRVKGPRGMHAPPHPSQPISLPPRLRCCRLTS